MALVVRVVVTMELEPTARGKTLHQRMSAPETAEERAIVERLRPRLDGAVRASGAGAPALRRPPSAPRLGPDKVINPS